MNDDANVEALLPLPAAAFHILLALSAGECHGYGIILDVQARTKGALHLSPGTLYRTIQRLVEDPHRGGAEKGVGPRKRSTAPLLPHHPLWHRRDPRRNPSARRAASTGQTGVARGTGVVVIRLYRALLHLYPAPFRMEYGDEMVAVFAQAYADATPVGRIAFFLTAAGDDVLNALAVHWAILVQDLRYTARTLKRARGFALTAILVPALGVGANTAASSVADFVLARPLPFADPEALVRLCEGPPYGRRLGLQRPAFASQLS